MNKKEILLIAGLIIFGLLLQYFDSGDIAFIKSCSNDIRSIRDKGHPHEFPGSFTFDNQVKKFEFDNPAGSIDISPSSKKRIYIETVKIVYHKDQSEIERLKNIVKIKKHETMDKAVIKVYSKESRFPYNRVRVKFKVFLPAATILKIRNRFGNINIDNAGTSITVDGKFGDIKIKNIDGDINVISRFGETNISDISGSIGLDLKYSNAEISNSSSLNCKVSHSSLSLSDFNKGNSIKIDGVHTKIKLSDIKSDLIKIKNSHNRIDLSDIMTKELLITSRHCKINGNRLNSESISIKNSFNKIILKELNGSKLNILLKHGNLYLSLGSMFKKVFITNSYSDITLFIPSGSDPVLSLNSKYGDIINRTDLKINSIKEKYLTTFSRIGDGSDININTSYGDIVLKERSN